MDHHDISESRQNIKPINRHLTSTLYFSDIYKGLVESLICTVKSSSAFVSFYFILSIFRYETECGYHIEYKEVEEDHPECRTEQVEKCTDNFQHPNFILPPQKKCHKVDVRRCQIVKKIIKKAKPIHQCKRVPRKQCSKLPCFKDIQNTKCWTTIKMEKQVKPIEECEMVVKRICETGGVCRKKLRTDCKWQTDKEDDSSLASDMDNAMTVEMTQNDISIKNAI